MLNETASFEQAQADLNDLVDYACLRFHAEKVIIVGHSYGTMLGSRYAIDYPDKVAAYIGVGQVVSIESDIYSYEDALHKATALGDDTEEMEVAYQAYLKEKSLTNMLNLRKHTAKYHVAEKASNTIWAGISSPYMGVDDVRWFLKQMQLESFISLNKKLFDYIMETDVRDYGLEYQMPVGFITGADDWTTPGKYAKEYCESIQAPQKQITFMEGCGHAPQYDAPSEFCITLKEMLSEYVK